ncbi:hypothetical protein HNQ02_000684 [Flavobacterium sp. 7E]|uniref:C10 family peptidase n=1 Tax=Flavobacterium sp. 7E TaxID=2735898 RepID=UPI00156EEFFC|nr:hypothetical protein [Flavobacterium sp. 7E]
MNGLCADEETVFLQQGSLDGACGPYCLFMALIILGEIEYEQATNLHTATGNTRLGKAIKVMETWKVLIHSGTVTANLKDFLDRGYSKRIKINTADEFRNKSLVHFIVDELNNNKPVLVSVYWSQEMGHRLLAVGYEANEKDNVMKLLFLDPSIPLGPNQYWNTAIAITMNYQKKYHHQWLNDLHTMVRFDDCFSIERT